MSVEQGAVRMGQCTITGKMFPEDELVTIQGHRVCAEGKAILLERLKSGEALPGERERPTVLRRFACIFVDGLIMGILYVIIGAVAGAGSFAVGAGRFGAGFTTAALITLLTTTIQVFYFGQMHASSGQTLGKKAGKLIVVNRDGSPISASTAYIRALAYTGPSYLNGIAILFLHDSPFLVSVGSLLVGIWGLTDVICALVDRAQQRSLHDRIAGTRVVEKES